MYSKRVKLDQDKTPVVMKGTVSNSRILPAVAAFKLFSWGDDRITISRVTC